MFIDKDRILVLEVYYDFNYCYYFSIWELVECGIWLIEDCKGFSYLGNLEKVKIEFMNLNGKEVKFGIFWV